MAKYKFDGKYLKINGKNIANVYGNKIREGSGSRVVANISGDKVREGSGSKTIFNVRGEDIRNGSGYYTPNINISSTGNIEIKIVVPTNTPHYQSVYIDNFVIE